MQVLKRLLRKRFDNVKLNGCTVLWAVAKQQPSPEYVFHCEQWIPGLSVTNRNLIGLLNLNDEARSWTNALAGQRK